jgi:hypothetical protein
MSVDRGAGTTTLDRECYSSSTKCIIPHDRHCYRMWRHQPSRDPEEGSLGRVGARMRNRKLRNICPDRVKHAVNKYDDVLIMWSKMVMMVMWFWDYISSVDRGVVELSGNDNSSATLDREWHMICRFAYYTAILITNRDRKIIYRGIIPLADDLLYVCQLHFVSFRFFIFRFVSLYFVSFRFRFSD